MTLQLFTIGFTETTAEHFFTLLRSAGVKRVIDVRLNNTSQLAAFTKKDDLRFFLRAVAGLDYIHVPELAPTQDILDAYKKRKGSWDAYEKQFNAILRQRAAENAISRETAHLGCLLCSEKEPLHCHRRLVAEYLHSHWPELATTHLV